MIFTDKPIAQTAKFNDAIKRASHALALLVSDVKFLIRDQELCAGCLARPDLGILMITFTSESEAVLLKKKGI